MVKRSTLQLYRTTIFLAQLCMAASNHLINNCDQKIRQVKNEIIKHKILKQLGLWSFCLVSSKGWSVLNNSWRDRFIHFSKTTEKKEKMRHRFEDSWNINVLNWKLYRKNKSIKTWNARKVEFLREITSFLLLKFEYANYLFPIQRLSCTFYDPAEYWL